MNDIEQKNHKTALQRVEKSIVALEDSMVAALLAEEKSRKEEDTAILQAVAEGQVRLGRRIEELSRSSVDADNVLASAMKTFIGNLTWQDRLRWIVRGTVKG